MAADKIHDDKLQKMLIRLLKKQELFFAFGLAKGGPTEHVLAFDKRKKGKMLFGMIKVTSEGITKGAWGTATAEGKVLKLVCEKPLSGLKRHVKAMFPKQPKFKGLLAKVETFKPDGQPLA